MPLATPTKHTNITTPAPVTAAENEQANSNLCSPDKIIESRHFANSIEQILKVDPEMHEKIKALAASTDSAEGLNLEGEELQRVGAAVSDAIKIWSLKFARVVESGRLPNVSRLGDAILAAARKVYMELVRKGYVFDQETTDSLESIENAPRAYAVKTEPQDEALGEEYAAQLAENVPGVANLPVITSFDLDPESVIASNVAVREDVVFVPWNDIKDQISGLQLPEDHALLPVTLGEEEVGEDGQTFMIACSTNDATQLAASDLIAGIGKQNPKAKKHKDMVLMGLDPAFFQQFNGKAMEMLYQPGEDGSKPKIVHDMPPIVSTVAPDGQVIILLANTEDYFGYRKKLILTIINSIHERETFQRDADAGLPVEQTSDACSFNFRMPTDVECLTAEGAEEMVDSAFEDLRKSGATLEDALSRDDLLDAKKKQVLTAIVQGQVPFHGAAQCWLPAGRDIADSYAANDVGCVTLKLAQTSQGKSELIEMLKVMQNDVLPIMIEILQEVDNHELRDLVAEIVAFLQLAQQYVLEPNGDDMGWMAAKLRDIDGKLRYYLEHGSFAKTSDIPRQIFETQEYREFHNLNTEGGRVVTSNPRINWHNPILKDTLGFAPYQGISAMSNLPLGFEGNLQGGAQNVSRQQLMEALWLYEDLNNGTKKKTKKTGPKGNVRWSPTAGNEFKMEAAFAGKDVSNWFMHLNLMLAVEEQQRALHGQTQMQHSVLYTGIQPSWEYKPDEYRTAQFAHSAEEALKIEGFAPEGVRQALLFGQHLFGSLGELSYLSGFSGMDRGELKARMKAAFERRFKPYESEPYRMKETLGATKKGLESKELITV